MMLTLFLQFSHFKVFVHVYPFTCRLSCKKILDASFKLHRRHIKLSIDLADTHVF